MTDLTIALDSIGGITKAENDRWRWFCGSPDYVFDKAEGRSLYLPVGGYAKAEGWGSDPAPVEICAAARAFVAAVQSEAGRIKQDRDAAKSDTMAAAIAVVEGIPAAARAEIDQINVGLRNRARMINEGGDGYVPRYDWTSKTGRDTLARHGVEPAQIDGIVAAIETLTKA